MLATRDAESVGGTNVKRVDLFLLTPTTTLLGATNTSNGTTNLFFDGGDASLNGSDAPLDAVSLFEIHAHSQPPTVTNNNQTQIYNEGDVTVNLMTSSLPIQTRRTLLFGCN